MAEKVHLRFHIPALPGMPVTEANSSCAYTQKIRRFCRMMTDRGHEVYLYGNPDDESAATEQFAVYQNAELPGIDDMLEWKRHNLEAGIAIRGQAERGDLLLIPYGTCQQSITGLTDMPVVEYGIGYGGVFSHHRVWESYAWMHTVLGWRTAMDGGNSHATDGAPNDTVIPNFFDLSEFPKDIPDSHDDYLLYVGRMVDRKGVHVAAAVAQELDVPLVMAGGGTEIPDYGDHIGPVGPKLRNELMQNARCLIAPTQYIEPFGGVAIEAMLCGTPVFASDWGAFTETVERPYRCRTVAEYVEAIDSYLGSAGKSRRKKLREKARTRYSLEAVAPQYERYFQPLADFETVASSV